MVLFFTSQLVASESKEAANDSANALAAIKAVASMPPIPLWNDEIIKKIREKLSGHETEAVAFAVKNIGSGKEKAAVDRACLRIMVVFEAETLALYEEIAKKNKGMSPQEKRALERWGQYVKDTKSLIMVINTLIDDVSAAEDVDAQTIGDPIRFSDIAFNLALDRIEGASVALGDSSIVTLDDIDVRTDRITKFKAWWKINAGKLEWGDVEKRFKLKK